ncbi:MAG: tetratricopeptide repeat protein [Bacteroidales bacterium]|nr:tetratricopeptide repeat protein [Bacteroidales bacterium]
MKSNYLNLILLLLCCSLSACHRSEHYYEEAEALFQKGLEFRAVKNTEAAAVSFSQALLTLNHCDTSKVEVKRLLGQLDDNLGAMYWKHGLKDDALVLHLDAVSIFSQLDDQPQLMKTLRNVGRVNSSLGRIEEAGKFYRAALQIAKTLSDKDFINETYMEMAHDLYLEGGEYEKALETATEAFSEEVDTCFCYLVIGLAHYYLENNNQALMYLEKAVQSNKASLRMSAYQGMYYIHVANDDYEDALEAHELYDENMIQADKEFNTREMQRIKSDYDLQLQKYSIQAEQHIKNLRYYILLGLLLAVLIMTLLLMRQKSLKGRLKVEETKNQMETAMKRNKVYVTALALTEQVTASTLDFELKENDWDDFMELVDVVYSGFTKKLLAKYPSLTKGDLQICCLTKQGFSNQVISILMNQQTASYARRKSRIKQEKMNGSGDDRSFEEIISQF